MQDHHHKQNKFLSTQQFASQHGMESFECSAKEKYFVFRSFVNHVETQSLIASEALKCHSRNEEKSGNTKAQGIDTHHVSSSKKSMKLNLGISCGGDLRSILPNAAIVARKAFHQASSIAKSASTATSLHIISNGPLSGLSLLYGVNAAMLPHCDSPTQPGQREEWLCMMSLGNTMIFRCDDETITIQSGDVIVMDAMATLHGVERVLPDDDVPPMCSRIGFPIPQVRLGILFWQGRLKPESNDEVGANDVVDLEGSIGLFHNDDDE